MACLLQVHSQIPSLSELESALFPGTLREDELRAGKCHVFLFTIYD